MDEYTEITVDCEQHEIHIGADVVLVIKEDRGRQVRIGIDAPWYIEIEREELASAREDSRAAGDEGC